MLQLRRILVPIDDTPLSDKALDHALTLAERFVAHLHVLYVRAETNPQGPDDHDRDQVEYATEINSVRNTAVRRLRAGHTLPESHIHAEVRTGTALDCILEAANDLGVDLIVMGTHGPKSLTQRVLGTTTERVLLRASQALWVVREDPE